MKRRYVIEVETLDAEGSERVAEVSSERIQTAIFDAPWPSSIYAITVKEVDADAALVHRTGETFSREVSE